MFTAMISTILGMLGGVLPDIMKEVRDSRGAARERELIELQARLQIETAQHANDAKLREIDAGIYVEEMKAMREHLTAVIEAQAKPTGIVWIDGFNAVLRPACTTLIILLFLMTAVPFVWAVLGQYNVGAIDAQTMAAVIFGSLVGESFMAVFGFLYGYRSTAKRA